MQVLECKFQHPDVRVFALSELVSEVTVRAGSALTLLFNQVREQGMIWPVVVWPGKVGYAKGLSPEPAWSEYRVHPGCQRLVYATANGYTHISGILVVNWIKINGCEEQRVGKCFDEPPPSKFWAPFMKKATGCDGCFVQDS